MCAYHVVRHVCTGTVIHPRCLLCVDVQVKGVGAKELAAALRGLVGQTNRQYASHLVALTCMWCIDDVTCRVY